MKIETIKPAEIATTPHSGSRPNTSTARRPSTTPVSGFSRKNGR
jgi:hypothetical protein